jgi:hypothetical protein
MLLSPPQPTTVGSRRLYAPVLPEQRPEATERRWPKVTLSDRRPHYEQLVEQDRGWNPHPCAGAPQSEDVVPSVQRHVDRFAGAYDPRSPTGDECAHGVVRKLEVLGDHVAMRQPAGGTQRPYLNVEFDQLAGRLNTRPANVNVSPLNQLVAVRPDITGPAWTCAGTRSRQWERVEGWVTPSLHIVLLALG